MASYMYGNLAVDERQLPGERVKIKEVRKVVYRRSTLPMKEKLMYLSVIVLCAVIAGMILWRYAQIYQMSTTIHRTEVQIQKLEAENGSLKEMLSKQQNPERLTVEMSKKGYSGVNEKNRVLVPSPRQPKEEAVQKP